MTCIVGLEHEGKVWMGGDSRAVSGYGHIRDTLDSKVFTRGELIFGNCGYPRQGQILRYNLAIPISPTKIENRVDGYIDEYIIGSLIPCIRQSFKDHGWMCDKNGREGTDEDGGPFLIGFRGCLYKVEDNFQALRPSSGFCSIGSGQDYAYGAIETLDLIGSHPEPERRLEIALLAVEKRDAGVSSPFTILSL